MSSPSPSVLSSLYLDADASTYEALCTSGVAAIGIAYADSTLAVSEGDGLTLSTIEERERRRARHQRRSNDGASARSSPSLPLTRGDSTDMDARLDVLEEVRLCSITPILPRTFPRYDFVQQVIPCTLRVAAASEACEKMETDRCVVVPDAVSSSLPPRPATTAATPKTRSSSGKRHCISADSPKPATALPFDVILRTAQRQHLLRALYSCAHPSRSLSPQLPAIVTAPQQQEPGLAIRAATGPSTEVRSSAQAGIADSEKDNSGGSNAGDARTSANAHAPFRPLHALGFESICSDSDDSSSVSSRMAAYAEQQPQSVCVSAEGNPTTQQDRRSQHARLLSGRSTFSHTARDAQRVHNRRRQRAWQAVTRVGMGAVVEWASSGAVGFTHDAVGLIGEDMIRNERTYYLPPIPAQVPSALDGTQGKDTTSATGAAAAEAIAADGADDLHSDVLLVPVARPAISWPELAGASSFSVNSTEAATGGVPDSELQRSPAGGSEARSAAMIPSLYCAPPRTLRAAAALQVLRLEHRQRERQEYFHEQTALPASAQRTLSAAAAAFPVAESLSSLDTVRSSAAVTDDLTAHTGEVKSATTNRRDGSTLHRDPRHANHRLPRVLALPCPCHHCSPWQPAFAQVRPLTDSLRPYLDHLQIVSTLPAVVSHGGDGADRQHHRHSESNSNRHPNGGIHHAHGVRTGPSSPSSTSGPSRTASPHAYIASPTQWTAATGTEVDVLSVFPHLAAQQPTAAEGLNPHGAPPSISGGASRGCLAANAGTSFAWLDEAVLDEVLLVAIAPRGAPYQQRLVSPSEAFRELLTTELAARLDRLVSRAVPVRDVDRNAHNMRNGRQATLDDSDDGEVETSRVRGGTHLEGGVDAQDAAWCRAVHEIMLSQFVRTIAATVPARLITKESLRETLLKKMCCCRIPETVKSFDGVPIRDTRASHQEGARTERNTYSQQLENSYEEEEEMNRVLQLFLAVKRTLESKTRIDAVKTGQAATSVANPGTDAAAAAATRAHFAAIRMFATTEAESVLTSLEDTLVDIMLAALRPILYRRICTMYELIRLLSSKALYVANKSLVAKYRAWYAETPAPGAVLRLMQMGELFSRALARSFPSFLPSPTEAPTSAAVVSSSAVPVSDVEGTAKAEESQNSGVKLEDANEPPSTANAPIAIAVARLKRSRSGDTERSDTDSLLPVSGLTTSTSHSDCTSTLSPTATEVRKEAADAVGNGQDQGERGEATRGTRGALRSGRDWGKTCDDEGVTSRVRLHQRPLRSGKRRRRGDAMLDETFSSRDPKHLNVTDRHGHRDEQSNTAPTKSTAGASVAGETSSAHAWRLLGFVPESALMHYQYLERFTSWVRHTHHATTGGGGGPSAHAQHTATANVSGGGATGANLAGPQAANAFPPASHSPLSRAAEGNDDHAHASKSNHAPAHSPRSPSSASAAASARVFPSASGAAADAALVFSPSAAISALVSGQAARARGGGAAGFSDPALTAVLRSLMRKGRTMTAPEVDHYILSTAHM